MVRRRRRLQEGVRGTSGGRRLGGLKKSVGPPYACLRQSGMCSRVSVLLFIGLFHTPGIEGRGHAQESNGGPGHTPEIGGGPDPVPGTDGGPGPIPGTGGDPDPVPDGDPGPRRGGGPGRATDAGPGRGGGLDPGTGHAGITDPIPETGGGGLVLGTGGEGVGGAILERDGVEMQSTSSQTDLFLTLIHITYIHTPVHNLCIVYL